MRQVLYTLTVGIIAVVSGLSCVQSDVSRTKGVRFKEGNQYGCDMVYVRDSEVWYRTSDSNEVKVGLGDFPRFSHGGNLIQFYNNSSDQFHCLPGLDLASHLPVSNTKIFISRGGKRALYEVDGELCRMVEGTHPIKLLRKQHSIPIITATNVKWLDGDRFFCDTDKGLRLCDMESMRCKGIGVGYHNGLDIFFETRALVFAKSFGPSAQKDEEFLSRQRGTVLDDISVLYTSDISGDECEARYSVGRMIEDPKWSPDGKRIVFAETNDRGHIESSMDVVVLDLESDKTTKVMVGLTCLRDDVGERVYWLRGSKNIVVSHLVPLDTLAPGALHRDPYGFRLRSRGQISVLNVDDKMIHTFRGFHPDVYLP